MQDCELIARFTLSRGGWRCLHCDKMMTEDEVITHIAENPNTEMMWEDWRK